MKKVYLLIFPLLVIFSLIFFREPIQLSLAKWYMGKITTQYFGENLEYDTAYFENGKIIFKNPRLLTSKAEALALQYSLHPKGISASLSIQHPEVNLQSYATNFYEEIRKNLRTHPFYISKLDFVFDQGIIHTPKGSFYCNLDGIFGNNVIVHLKSWLDPQFINDHYLDLTINDQVFNIHVEGSPKKIPLLFSHPLIEIFRQNCADDHFSLISQLTITNDNQLQTENIFSISDRDGNNVEIKANIKKKTNANMLEGDFSINDGFYLEKKWGVLLSDAKGSICFNNEQAHFKNAEFFSNGVFFGGDGSINYEEAAKGIYDIQFNAQTMAGNVSQIQKLFSHYDQKQLFLKIPIEGHLSFIKEGGFFHVKTDPNLPEGYSFEAQLDGALTEGSYTSASLDIVLQDLSSNFKYNSLNNTLDFSDIQGLLLVGKPGHVDEYDVSGDKLNFTNLATNQLEFDIWVGNKKRDILRLAGKTDQKEVIGQNKINFSFDNNLTHFGDVHPQSIKMTLKDWFEIDFFKLEADFKLDTLFRDLQRLGKSGLFFLSENALKAIQDVKSASGNINIGLEYDPKLSQFLFNINGNDVALNQRTTKKFVLNGKKQENTWSIEHLQLDNIALSTDLKKDNDNWNIIFLGLRYADALLIGLEGVYYPKSNHVDAQLKLIELNLNNAGNIPELKQFAQSFDPKGELRAIGKLGFDFFKEESAWHLEADLKMETKSASFKNIVVRDSNAIKCHIDSDAGIILKNCEFLLKGEKGSPFSQFKLGEFTFRNNREIYINDFHFQIPPNNLVSVMHFANEQFPNTLSDIFQEITSGIKLAQDITGTLSFSGTRESPELEISIDSNTIYWNNFPKKLEKTTLTLNPYELKLHSNDYTLNGTWNKKEKIFLGSLEGKNFQWGNYHLESLQANVGLSPSEISLKDVTISDAAAHVYVAECTIKNEIWFPFEIPHLTVTDFHPAALQLTDESSKEWEKSFFINLMEVNNLHGYLGNSSSYKGEGFFQFNNKLKDASSSQFFAIPSDLKIELDTRVLNPATGTIYYTIGDEKIHLTKFKDVYSEGKLSKFYLAKASEGSFIDLDGNLNIQLKIKQYNLLFKLAEFFTFSIQGNLQKPIYAIQKNEK